MRYISLRHHGNRTTGYSVGLFGITVMAAAYLTAILFGVAVVVFTITAVANHLLLAMIVASPLVFALAILGWRDRRRALRGH